MSTEATDPGTVFEQAAGLHRAGRLDEAAALYDRLLAQFPDHADTLQLRGAVELQRSSLAASLAWFDRALAANADLAAAHINRAAALIGLGRFEEALASAEKGEALAPSSVAAVNNLVSVLNKLGRPDDALAAAGRAMAHGVEDAALHVHRAESFMARHRYSEMVDACDRALAFDPELSEAHGHRGHALTQLKRAEDAAESFAKALAREPNSAVAHYSRALALQFNRQYADAIASCDRALALQPVFPEALITRAAANEALERFADVVADCDRLLALQPDSAEGYALRGIAFKGLKQPERALADLEVAIELDPDLMLVPGHLVYLSMLICEWDGLAAKIDSALQALEAGKYAIQPMSLLSFPSSPRHQKKAAQLCFAALDSGRRSVPAPARTLNGKLRIGYFSSDLHDHPVGQLLVGLLEAHDRTRFEIAAFSFGGDPDNPTQKRIARACDMFIDAKRMSNTALAEKAREMNIHIAVDLNGYSAGLRTDVFADGVAPIQVNYLGFAATMGTDRIHYIIGDDVVTPGAHFGDFTECVVTMPGSYLVTNDIKGKVPARLSSRCDFGLPERGFVFCSFNAAYKITPEAFDVWMRLLREVEGSILWLTDHGPTATRNLRAEAKARGVSPDRLFFAARTAGLDYLARYRVADLFLDTFEYNAHATCSEALMVGLPVLTRRGATFAGRVAASLLTAIGLDELIASDTAGYERTALRLARDAEVFGRVRAQLAQKASESGLFDTQRYARNLEKAYAEMWRRHEQGLPPDHINVRELV